MKFLAVLSLSLISLNAFAGDRAIYDLMYLPNAGTNFGITDLNLLSAKIESSNSGFSNDAKVKGYALEQTLGRSLTDRFLLSADINYSKTTTEQDQTGSSIQTSESKGLSDPTLTARYRLLDDAFILDVIGAWTIKSGDSKTDSSSDSNAKQGGNSLKAGLQLGQKSEKFQWAILGNFIRYGEMTDNSSDGKIKDDAHNEWQFEGRILSKIAEKSYINAGASVSFTDSYDNDETPAEMNASVTTYRLDAAYQHLCTEKLLAKIGVRRDSVQTDTGTFSKYELWYLTAGATYQF